MALTDVFERSIFKNLPNSLSNKLGNRHPADPNKLPQTHNTQHNTKGFDKINKLMHEVPEANKGLFAIPNYGPGARIAGQGNLLHSMVDGSVFIRRPEVENENNLLKSLDSFSTPQKIEITTGNPRGIPLVHPRDPAAGKFNYDTGIANLTIPEPDIYNKYSNRSGFLSQPFLETKLQGTPNTFGLLEAGVRDAERLGKFVLSTPSFSGRQIFLQGFNSTLETKVWNPLSIFNPNLGLLGTSHTDRHASTGLGSKLIDQIPGVNSPFPDVRTYEEALRKTPFQSRNVNQSPFAGDVNKYDDPTGNRFRDRFFEDAKSDMTSLYEDTNPNKYKWPVGSDGAGLPFSGRPSPREQAERDKGLINIGAKFTKHIGFSKESLQQSKLKELLPSVLTSIPLVSQINSVASVLGFGKPKAGMEDKGNLYSNQYNPSFLYFVGNQIQNVPLTGEAPVNINREGALPEGTSPLTEILRIMAETSEITSKTSIKPAYTFLNKGDLKNQLGQSGQFTQDQTPQQATEKSKAVEDSRLKLDNYLQSYGEIGRKHESKAIGAGDPTRRSPRSLPAGTYLHYEAFKERSRESTMRVNYGFAGQHSEYKPETSGFDRISALDVGEKPEDIQPYLEEMIPFRFFHINENRWVIFRAYLTGIVENNTANWNEKRYIGRADPVYTYIGATRKLNFTFDVHPESAKELSPLWKKINAVTGMCWPSYVDIPRGTEGDPAGQYMLGPFVRLTIGDMYNQVPGIINGVTLTVDDVGTWETRRGVIDNIELAHLPKYVKINVDFTIIGKEIFDANANFFDFNEGFENNGQTELAEVLPRTG